MRFIDEVKIKVISGNGGNGAATFRREKFIPYGGPDGGNGGHGGSVILRATSSHNTLAHFRGRRIFKAEHGEGGMSRQKDGKTGEDYIIEVPVGTLVKYQESGEMIADLTNEGQEFLLAKGGRGGLGNINFKSSTNQAPQYAQKGKEGVELDVTLELKLLADVALIGSPNAGKSTLISRLSAARPKVADYAFTTLVPNLGVVEVPEQDFSFVVADIPGLIEDASEGKGLGTKFLRHIERTRVLVHLVDCSLAEEAFEAFEEYVMVREELDKYSKKLTEKREVVCLTKIDAMQEEDIEKFKQFFQEQLGRNVLPLSSVSGKNINVLKLILSDLVKEERNQGVENHG